MKNKLEKLSKIFVGAMTAFIVVLLFRLLNYAYDAAGCNVSCATAPPSNCTFLALLPTIAFLIIAGYCGITIWRLFNESKKRKAAQEKSQASKESQTKIPNEV